MQNKSNNKADAGEDSHKADLNKILFLKKIAIDVVFDVLLCIKKKKAKGILRRCRKVTCSLRLMIKKSLFYRFNILQISIMSSSFNTTVIFMTVNLETKWSASFKSGRLA